MKKTSLSTLTLLLATAISARAVAQAAGGIDINTIGKDSRWKIAGRTVSAADIKGKHAIHLSEGAGAGIVWLDGYNFTNGAIDVDLLGRSEPVQGSFIGVAFRVADAQARDSGYSQTHDVVYFRPFNFRAADSARHAHAVQYASHPQYPWPRLRSEHPGQYEQPLVPAPDGDEWFHARIVVARSKVSVYVNGATQPSLVVNELSDRTNGSIGLWVGEGSGGYFANLHVTPAK